eukprot:gene13089-17543_t
MILDYIEPSLNNVLFTSFEHEVKKETSSSNKRHHQKEEKNPTTPFEGKGTAELDNGCKYQGSFRNGLFNGKGKFTWSDGVKFEGDFELGVIVGKGVYKWPDGSHYNGEVNDGKRHGNGKFHCFAGQVYDGEWYNGMRHGRGKMFYNEEMTSYYEGDWKNNLRDGYGVMKYPSGNQYDGDWKNDKKCGQGVMVWKDTDEIYCGGWDNDLQHGYGEHIWSEGNTKLAKKFNCNIYRGDYNYGLKHGLGTFFYMNGSQYSGCWLDDHKHGDGVYIYPDGSLFAGLFHTDRMQFLSNDDNPNNKQATEDVNPQFRLNIMDVFSRGFNLAPKEMSDVAKNKIINQSPLASLTTSTTPSNDPKIISIQNEVKEVERLLLRYNQYIKILLKKYTDYAMKQRNKDIISSTTSGIYQKYLDILPINTKTIVCTRNIHKKFFCLSLEQMVRFLREIGLIQIGVFHSIDVSECYRRMKYSIKNLTSKKLYDYKQDEIKLKYIAERTEAIRLEEERLRAVANASKSTRKSGYSTTKPSSTNNSRASSPRNSVLSSRLSSPRNISSPKNNNPIINIIEEYPIDLLPTIAWDDINIPLLSLWDSFYEPRAMENDFDISSSQPLLEREFIELFIRCVAEITIRNNNDSIKPLSTSDVGLSHVMKRVLAEKVLPLSSDYDNKLPAFVRLFHSESIQDLISHANPTNSHVSSSINLLTNNQSSSNIQAKANKQHAMMKNVKMISELEDLWAWLVKNQQEKSSLMKSYNQT